MLCVQLSNCNDKVIICTIKIKYKPTNVKMWLYLKIKLFIKGYKIFFFIIYFIEFVNYNNKKYLVTKSINKNFWSPFISI